MIHLAALKVNGLGGMGRQYTEIIRPRQACSFSCDHAIGRFIYVSRVSMIDFWPYLVEPALAWGSGPTLGVDFGLGQFRFRSLDRR